MSFNVKNPYTAFENNDTPSTPPEGTRGFFPKEDGWYDIDDKGNVKKVGLTVDQTYSPTSENAQSGKAVAEAIADIQVSGKTVQSDWNETDTESMSYIQNKPTIPTKLSDLEDDKVVENANHAFIADSVAVADMSWADGLGNNISDTYATKTELGTIESIAKGRATGYVFDTEFDLDMWLEDSENTSKLVLGDNLYIRATDVPDYWWDGAEKQILETQKVDLSEYAKTENVPTKFSDLEDDKVVENSVFAQHAAWADNANHDDQGNYITRTYATKSELGDVEEALNESIALCDSYISWEVPV